MDYKEFVSVWDAIEDNPLEAEKLKLISLHMRELENYLARAKVSDAQAAKVFGVVESRISDLKHGRINQFDLNTLTKMASAAGLRISVP